MNIVKMEKNPVRPYREAKNPGEQSREKANLCTSLLQVPRNTNKPTSRRFKEQADAYQLNVSKFFKEQLIDMEIYTPEAPLRTRYKFVDKSKLPTEKIFTRIQRNLHLLNEKLGELEQYEWQEEYKKDKHQLKAQQDTRFDLRSEEKEYKTVQTSRQGGNELDCQAYTFVAKANKLSCNKAVEQ